MSDKDKDRRPLKLDKRDDTNEDYPDEVVQPAVDDPEEGDPSGGTSDPEEFEMVEQPRWDDVVGVDPFTGNANEEGDDREDDEED